MTPADELEMFGFQHEHRRAVLYTRVSHVEQVQNGHSLENQIERLRKFAEAHSYRVVEEISDEARSGQKTNRPGFQKVLSLVESGGADAVIVYSLSRFARNTVATLEAISLMKENDVSFLSLTENIDTKSAAGEFFITVLAAFAQMEAKTASERIRSVMELKKSKGEHLGNTPFGWKKEGAGIVKNADEQEVIRLVVEMRARGWSLAEIARQLKKRQLKNRAGNSDWRKTQVKRILDRAEKQPA